MDNFLYFNVSTPGKIRLFEEGSRSGTARDDRGSPNGSMGVDVGDSMADGLPSIFVTNYEGEKHALYHNDWKPQARRRRLQLQIVGVADFGRSASLRRLGHRLCGRRRPRLGGSVHCQWPCHS